MFLSLEIYIDSKLVIVDFKFIYHIHVIPTDMIFL